MRTIVTIALAIYSFKKIQKATRSSLYTYLSLYNT